MVNWCNSLVTVPKFNGRVLLCIDPARLNYLLIGPIHRGPTLKDTLPNVTNACHMTIIDACSGYKT